MIDRLWHYFYPEPQNNALTITAFNKLSERYRISDYLTYRYADEGGIWLADNPKGMDSYLLGFEVSPLIVAGDKTTQKIESILSKLPVGCVVHSIAHASKDVYGYLERWSMSRRKGSCDIFDAMTQRRAKYIVDWAEGVIDPIKGNNFRPRVIRYYWFVRFPSSHKDFSSSNQFLEEVHRHRERIISEFSSSNLQVFRLMGSELIRVIRLIGNWHLLPKDIHERSINRNALVAPQIFDIETSLEVTNEGDIIFSGVNPSDKRYVRMLTATHFPEHPFYISKMADCIGSVCHASEYLPGDFCAYTVMEVLSRESVKFKAGKKMAVLQYQTASTKEFWQQMMRPLYKRKNNVQNLFDAIDKKGVVPVKAWSGIVLSGRDPAELEQSSSIAQSLWKFSGFELYREKTIALPIWMASLPGQYRSEMDDMEKGIQRGTTMRAYNAASLSHVQGDWKGSHPNYGGLMVMSRRGVLTNINLFDTFKSNYNVVMAASSGSGKSFTVNEIITDFLSKGGIVRVIDAGRSYYNTAEIFGGRNLIFNRGKQLCINPFTHILTEDLLKEDMDTLVMLVAQMAFPFGFGQKDMGGEDKPYEYRCIEEAIESIWVKMGSKMSIRDIADYFSESQEPSLVRISRQLRPWAYGRYAEWLVGEANVSFDDRFLVLELDELSDEPELQSVVLNFILSNIAREMYLNTRSELDSYGYKLPKLIVIDEAWDLLGKPNTGSFIEKAYRRARKYLCAIVIVTQSFTDCDKTSAARTALENANWIITLVHDIGSLEKAIDRGILKISQYSKDMIQRLQKTDDYSELYVINKSLKGEGLYRLLVDPYTYWTYTTEGGERAQLDALVSRGMKIDKAIETILEKQPSA